MRRALQLMGSVTAFLAPFAAVGGDFNGDGFDDLAVTAVGEGGGFFSSPGAVHVFPGSGTGPQTTTSILIEPALVGLAADIDASFGLATTWGDFDGDGFDDLVIGAPGAPVAGLGDAGRVFVLHGAASGLDLADVRVFDQNTKGIKDKVEESTTVPGKAMEYFGGSLAPGDFNADGYDDLAIGVSDERLGKAMSAGAVHVLFGSAVGLRAKRNQLWHQNRSGIKDRCETLDRFGEKLVRGDFNGDGFDDLAIAVSGEHDATTGYGRVAMLFGSKKGLRAKRNALFKPESALVPLTAPAPGASLVFSAGDFDADAYEDLAIGNAYEDLGGQDRGVVFVVRGSPIGPITASIETYTKGDGTVPGVAADGDLFGTTVAAGDFDGDGVDDLAIGAPGESSLVANGGRVTVLRGAMSSGLSGSGSAVFDQDTSGVAGVAQSGDLFGFGLAVLDANGDGAADVAIGVPGETVGAAAAAGSVNVLLGQLGVGVQTVGDVWLSQDAPGVPGTAEANDLFGLVMQN